MRETLRERASEPGVTRRREMPKFPPAGAAGRTVHAVVVAADGCAERGARAR